LIVTGSFFASAVEWNRPEAALAAHVLVVLLLLALLVLARNREHVVRDPDLDLVGLDARNVRADREDGVPNLPNRAAAVISPELAF
jgi:hypothetical protein